MHKKVISFSMGLICVVMATSVTAVPVTVENYSFELPGTGKISNNWGLVPGWSSDSAPADSGVEVPSFGPNPTDGQYQGFLQNGDPSIWQTTSYVIGAGETYVLQVDCWLTWQATDLVVSLYYDDNGARVSMGSTTVAITSNTPATYTVAVQADDTPAAIGNNLGIEIDHANGTGGWFAIDNVRLDSLLVSLVAPADGATLVSVDQDLSWTVANNWAVDLYLGTENDPNLHNNPANKKLTQQVATSYDPGTLAHNTTYYWTLDVHEPNTVGTIIRTNPVWHFTTVPATPVVATSPTSQTVSAGSNVVLTVSGVNETDYAWYYSADPMIDPAGDVAVGTNSDTLTINNIQLANEGWYYCVISNGAGEATSDAALVLTSRMMGWWKLDGDLSDAIQDVVAGAPANDGVATGPNPDPNFAPGIDGQALDLIQGQDFVIMDANDLYNFYPQGFTVSAWVQTTETGWNPFVGKQVSATSGWVLSMSSANNATITIRDHDGMDSGDGNLIGDESSLVNDGTWHHIVGSYDAATGLARIYVDGVVRDESDANTSTLNTDNSMALALGVWDSSNASSDLTGLIDDVRLWNFAVDPFTIAQLYVNGAGGEVCVEFPQADLTGPEGAPDCVVNMLDFAMTFNDWLTSNVVSAP